jgi:hypothetical protein
VTNKQDVIAQSRQVRGLVEMHEEFSGTRNRRLRVARFATRWFVLEFWADPINSYVHGPFDGHPDAHSHAIRMHREATGKPPCTIHEVES